MIAVLLIAVLLLASPAAAQNAPAGMPDPRQMSGIPLPSADVAAGTITVRVIKGSLANVIPNQPVELQVGTTTRKASTDAAGRASFEEVAFLLWKGRLPSRDELIQLQQTLGEQRPLPAHSPMRRCS